MGPVAERSAIRKNSRWSRAEDDLQIAGSSIGLGRAGPAHITLEASSALNQVDDQDADGNYEQEMDQTAANVANKPTKPEHHQDYNYSPKHSYPFRLS